MPGGVDACYTVGPIEQHQEPGVPLQTSCISVGPRVSHGQLKVQVQQGLVCCTGLGVRKI